MEKTKKNQAGIVVRIPLKNITPSKENPRKSINPEELNELADSIKENGLLQPITVRPIEKDKYEIVCGERRYRATELTGAEEIECIVKELDDKAALAAMVIENMQRNDVDPIDEAAAIGRLVNDFGTSIQEVAKMLGKSETFVWGRIRLNNTIPDFIQLLRDGILVLTHLLEICRYPQDEQRILFDTCFTPECRARWTKQWPNMQELGEMIDANVTMKLSTARFSLNDSMFDGCNACEGCPFNDQGRRCMNRACFLAKQQAQVLREAKAQPVGTELVYAGTEEENLDVLNAARDAGLEIVPVGMRKYVIDPPQPDKEKFTEEEYYERRMATWRHAKEVFDLGVKDGNIVPVFEICFSGHLSGERKFVYNVSVDDGETSAEERQRKQEQTMKIKGWLSELDEKKHDEVVAEMRKAVGESEYSKLNTALTAVENDVLIALLLKHLPYEFKQSLHIEWVNDPKFFSSSKEAITKNRNSIKREFIRLAMSDKSVDYSRDLQGVLEMLMDDQFAQTKANVLGDADEKYKKQRDKLRKQIDDLKAKPQQAE